MKEVIVHTGQHFDKNMSDIFFEQLDIPRPQHNLHIAGLAHGAMTGRMLEGIETIIKDEQPDWVLVYGDTNSTLAGALAATKLHVPVAHVEAGLRSHNPAMPEEINRVLTDRISSLLLCPTENAVENLKKEGFPFTTIGPNRIPVQQCFVNTGDVMFDALLHYRARAQTEFSLEGYGLSHQTYALCTLHRQENTDCSERLANILAALREVAKDIPVLIPLHPRTRVKIQNMEQKENPLIGITLCEPLSYLEMQRLQMSAKVIITDSGGIQKEAYFHRIPCVTLRDETEWIETVRSGWNTLVGTKANLIVNAVKQATPPLCEVITGYGEGNASRQIVENIRNSVLN